jgi:hypothetical protein
MGGSAIKQSERINAANLQETYNLALKVLSDLGVDTKALFPLGSFGKKGPEGTYGDIDIAVPLTVLEKFVNSEEAKSEAEFVDDAARVLEQLLIEEGLTARWMKGLQVLSFAVPIVDVDGQQPDSWAQIDLMFSSQPEFSRWMYHSPDIKESRWKGLYRNILLMAIANVISKQILESEEGLPVEWSVDTLDLISGLKNKYMSLKGKRGLLRNPKVLSKEFYDWGRDVQRLVNYLLGKGVEIKQTYTFEDVWRIVSNPQWEHYYLLPEIKKEFVRKLPEELEVPQVVLEQRRRR